MENRGLVIQQGGAKALIPLALEGSRVGKQKAAHALSKIAITNNPATAFPGQRVSLAFSRATGQFGVLRATGQFCVSRATSVCRVLLPRMNEHTLQLKFVPCRMRSALRQRVRRGGEKFDRFL